MKHKRLITTILALTTALALGMTASATGFNRDDTPEENTVPSAGFEDNPNADDSAGFDDTTPEESETCEEVDIADFEDFLGVDIIQQWLSAFAMVRPSPTAGVDNSYGSTDANKSAAGKTQPAWYGNAEIYIESYGTVDYSREGKTGTSEQDVHIAATDIHNIAAYIDKLYWELEN